MEPTCQISHKALNLPFFFLTPLLILDFSQTSKDRRHNKPLSPTLTTTNNPQTHQSQPSKTQITAFVFHPPPLKSQKYKLIQHNRSTHTTTTFNTTTNYPIKPTNSKQLIPSPKSTSQPALNVNHKPKLDLQSHYWASIITIEVDLFYYPRSIERERERGEEEEEQRSREKRRKKKREEKKEKEREKRERKIEKSYNGSNWEREEIKEGREKK